MPEHTDRATWAPHGYVPHVNLEQHDGKWSCVECGCPHEAVAAHGAGGFNLVAIEARRCLASFETPCRDCGQVYECAKDCAGMAALLAALEADPDVRVIGAGEALSNNREPT